MTKNQTLSDEISGENQKLIPARLGFWSSLILTVLGGVYLVVMLLSVLFGQISLPPSESLQLFAAIETIIMAPLIIMLLTSVHYLVPKSKKVLSHCGLMFACVFAAMVSINRFVQLGVVRLSILGGDTEGLKRFLPYEPRSAMFALEQVGWGFFLGLALLFISLALSSKGFQKRVRYTFMLYSVLAIVSVVAYVVNSPIAAIGFVAWGLILYIGTALLTISFKNYEKHW